MNNKPGIYYDMPAKEYFADIGLNKSSMPYLLRSPHHFRMDLRTKKEQTPSMIFGSAMHMRILEPNEYHKLVSEHKFKTPKSAGERIFLNRNHLEDIENIYDNIQKHSITKDLLRNGSAEVSIFWKDPAYGFMCKARIDYLREDLGIIADLKFCQNATHKEFSKSAANYNYHWQARWYRMGMITLGLNLSEFLFVCIEGRPYYSIQVYRVTELMDSAAMADIDAARLIFNNCLRENKWPSYGEKIYDLYLPHWA